MLKEFRKKIVEIDNKYQKAINMLIYPIEFIMSLMLAYVMLRYSIINFYEGYHSLKHIILILGFGIVILFILIYNCKKNKNKFEKIVVGFLIPIGMMYLVFVLPSQVPDEQAHLRRAYEVSEGVLIGEKNGESSIPRDLQTKIKPNIESYKQFSQNIAEKTDYNDKVQVGNSAGTYPFILYIFSSIGFIIARVFGLNILIGCYLAKLMNFIVFLISAYYTLKIIPFGKYAYTAVMFMPMFMHQATSTSADCIVNIFVMLFLAFLLKLYFKSEQITKKEEVILIILSCLTALVKYVYLPITAMSLILIWSKNISKKEKILTISIMLILSIIIAGAYYKFTGTYETTFNKYFTENNVNAGEQIKGIVNNPIGFLKTIKYTFINMGEVYVYQMIGNSLGWLCIYTPNYWITMYLFVMLFSCFLEDNKFAFNKLQKVWGILISFGIIVLILTGMYITWTRVGNIIIDGVQGRYFIPIAFLVLLCLCKKHNYIKIKNIQYKLPIILILLNLPELNSIYHFFLK